jgi:hypothetical protein
MHTRRTRWTHVTAAIVNIMLLYIGVRALKRGIVSDGLKSTKLFRSLFNHTRSRAHCCYNVTYGSPSTHLRVLYTLQLGINIPSSYWFVYWVTHSSTSVRAYYYFYYCVTLFSTDRTKVYTHTHTHVCMYVCMYVYILRSIIKHQRCAVERDMDVYSKCKYTFRHYVYVYAFMCPFCVALVASIGRI